MQNLPQSSYFKEDHMEKEIFRSVTRHLSVHMHVFVCFL